MPRHEGTHRKATKGERRRQRLLASRLATIEVPKKRRRRSTRIAVRTPL